MELKQAEYPRGTVAAKNIGGIRETTVEFSPGVTILVGRNATNRTSFLQAVMAALGSKNGSIKGDAEEAKVELTLGENTYTRQLQRRSGGVVTDGEPYLDDPELSELFAFLLESNEARQAVATNDDLRELIMRPVDTDAIQAEIDDLVQERTSIEEELEEINSLKADIPDLEEKRRQMQDHIEDKRAELDAKESELEAADTDIEETREEKSELEDKLEELRSKRSQLDDVRYDLETERESLNATEAEKQDLERKEAELPEMPAGETSDLDADITRLRERKQRLETEVNDLQSVIGFNEEMLNNAGSDAFGDAIGEEGETTDALLANDITCWTCGSDVEREQIETTVAQLRDLSQTKVSEIADLDEKITGLNDRKATLEQSQRERDRIERQLSAVDDKLADGRERVEQLQERRENLTEEIDSIEVEVEQLESEEYSAVLDLHKEANQLEYELGRLENDRERVGDDITEREERIAEQDTLEAQLDEVRSKIEDQRTKMERIESEAIDHFNNHMDTVLDMLGYANLDRVWLEQVDQEVREGRKSVTKSVFELHIVRTSESGTVYEDTVNHLSESEREVVGLVFALAGYLAHEVYETVPVMLLDSLEAIDSERIATLVDYLTNHTGYLFVALLPDDAAALPKEYERLTEL